MEQQMIQRYRQEIYRIGWRLQYRSKRTRRHECTFMDIRPAQRDEAEEMINRLSVEQLLDTLPAKGKVILQKIYLQEMTEAEVAAQLHMSQQGLTNGSKKCSSSYHRQRIRRPSDRCPPETAGGHAPDHRAISGGHRNSQSMHPPPAGGCHFTYCDGDS